MTTAPIRRHRDLTAAAVTLGLAASPAVLHAALIDITTPQTTPQAIGDGDSLRVSSPNGSIITNGNAVTATGTITIGGFENQGTVTSNDSTAVLMDLSVTIDGDILNSGSINAPNTGANAGGIELITATMTGEVRNTGTISADSDGIYVNNSSSITGGIVNASGGTITSAGSDGIDINDGSIVASITNAGTITADDNGIEIGRDASISGDVVNSGTIDADNDGIELDTGTITGVLRNSGVISGDNDGIYVNDTSSIQGGIVNEAGGEIVSDFADGIDINDGSTVASITNAGTITADDNGIEIGASSTVGSITNTGTITGDDASIDADATSLVQNGIDNSGTLTGQLDVDGTDGSGGGIDLSNSGSIDILDSESLLSGDFTQTGTGALAVMLLSFGDYTAAPLAIAGDASIDGELMLGFDPGFVFSPLSRFTLIDVGGSRTGLFNNYANGARVANFGGRNNIFIDYTAEGDIDLYATPLPGTAALIGIGALAGLGGLARRRRPA